MGVCEPSRRERRGQDFVPDRSRRLRSQTRVTRSIVHFPWRRLFGEERAQALLAFVRETRFGASFRGFFNGNRLPREMMEEVFRFGERLGSAGGKRLRNSQSTRHQFVRDYDFIDESGGDGGPRV